jgi:hypothetical protein
MLPRIGHRTADRERRGIEDRLVNSKVERPQLFPHGARPRHLDHQDVDHRSLDDQPRVPLNVHGIAAIIMDAVRIEPDNRKAEKWHRVRVDNTFPVMLGR